MSKTRPGAVRQNSADDQAACRILLELRAAPEIFAAIEVGPDDELALQRRLREAHPDELVRAALRLQDLRKKATAKFDRAAEMWFDRVGLEQATSEPVARHKAVRFEGAVDDLCCGVGGDTIALAKRCDVRAIDLYKSLTLMTKWNAEIYGAQERVLTVPGAADEFLSGDTLVHIDPDRRSGAQRSVRIEDYRPGLDDLARLIDSRPGGAIKLSPASNFGGKFPGCEIELVSHRGECKEATVWFGSLAGNAGWRATVLPSGETITGEPLELAAEIGPCSAFVYDPDPAVVRSGLLDVVTCQLGLKRLDPEEEYLTGDELMVSGFVTPFEVLDDLPRNDKLIRRYFRERAFGAVEIKCRHIRLDIDAYRRKLSRTGTEPVTLIFARVERRSRVLVCRRPASDDIRDPATN